MNFKFNVTGVSGDITVNQTVPGQQLVAAHGALNGDGTGDFSFGIMCSACANGAAGGFTNAIVFHVLNATVANVTAPNNLGNIFVADVLAPNGNTGPVDVTATPEPALLILLGVGLTSVGAAIRRRRR
jgi:hypothetical protein